MLSHCLFFQLLFFLNSLNFLLLINRISHLYDQFSGIFVLNLNLLDHSLSSVHFIQFRLHFPFYLSEEILLELSCLCQFLHLLVQPLRNYFLTEWHQLILENHLKLLLHLLLEIFYNCVFDEWNYLI